MLDMGDRETAEVVEAVRSKTPKHRLFTGLDRA
jgi:hypothetical protein